MKALVGRGEVLSLLLILGSLILSTEPWNLVTPLCFVVHAMSLLLLCFPN